MPGLGQPATNRLLAAGVRPSLGVDTETIVSGDMFGVMRAALACQQLVLAGAAGPMDRAPGLPAFDAAGLLAFATIEGARACGIDDRTGSLTPGKEADIIMIRMDRANLLPATRRTSPRGSSRRVTPETSNWSSSRARSSRRTACSSVEKPSSPTRRPHGTGCSHAPGSRCRPEAPVQKARVPIGASSWYCPPSCTRWTSATSRE